MRDGRLAQISDFRENDQLTATIITTMPPRIVTEKEVQATLAKSAAPAGSASAATSTSSSTPRPAAAPQGSAATSGAAPRQLPTTAGPLPVLGIGGLASLLVGVGFTVRRRAAKS
jgi:cobalamin biosynthesis Mg chelatase CobN